MSRLLQLAVVATVATAAPTVRADRGQPNDEPCVMTATLGHVPGRMVPIWVLRCRPVSASESAVEEDCPVASQCSSPGKTSVSDRCQTGWSPAVSTLKP